MSVDLLATKESISVDLNSVKTSLSMEIARRVATVDRAMSSAPEYVEGGSSSAAAPRTDGGTAGSDGRY
jgi:hypothetical protein